MLTYLMLLNQKEKNHHLTFLFSYYLNNCEEQIGSEIITDVLDLGNHL